METGDHQDNRAFIRRMLIAGAIAFAAGLPVVVATYFLLGRSTPASHIDDMSADRVAEQAQPPNPIAELEEFRKFMSPEQFDEIFGAAIRHEQENPTTYVMTSAEIDSLPDFVNRLNAPTLTDADLARLADRVAVNELDLGDNPNVTDDGMRHVARIAGLHHLSLYSTAVTDAGIRHLRGLPLTYINLWHTSIGDESLGYIAEMKPMKQVQIKDCQAVTDAGVAKLVALENLQIVNLGECRRITDESVRLLSGIPSVEFIQVFRCPNISQQAINEFLSVHPDRTVHR
jgi:hypothetical protein